MKSGQLSIEVLDVDTPALGPWQIRVRIGADDPGVAVCVCEPLEQGIAPNLVRVGESRFVGTLQPVQRFGIVSDIRVDLGDRVRDPLLLTVASLQGLLQERQGLVRTIEGQVRGSKFELKFTVVRSGSARLAFLCELAQLDLLRPRGKTT